jgi:hypothetical protein
MSKNEFETLCRKYESVGMLPKGKTADLMENYDTITAPPAEPGPASLGTFGTFAGTLSVDRSNDDVDHDALDEQTKKRARKV